MPHDRPVDEAARGLVTPLQRGAERRFPRGQLARHADPLCALAGQHERDPGRCVGVHDALGRGSLAARIASQRIRHGRAVVSNENRTMIQRGPTRRGIPANVVERGCGVVGQQVGIKLRQRAQRLRAFRRQRQQLRLSTAGRNSHGAGRRRLFKHHVAVRAGDSKRADAG